MTITLNDVTSIYAVAYGFKLYETIFYALLYSGVLLLPLLIMAYRDAKAVYALEDGGQNPGPESRQQFWRWFSVALILPLFVIPWTQVELTDIKLSPRCNQQQVSFAETGTSFDSPFLATFSGTEEIYGSPALIFVVSLSQGLRASVENTLPCLTDMLAVHYSLRNVTLSSPGELDQSTDSPSGRDTDFDPPAAGSGFCQGGPGYTCYTDQALLAELDQFEQACYRPAVARLEAAMSGDYGEAVRQNVDASLSQKIGEWEEKGFDAGTELHYIGNRYFVETEGFYLPCEGDACPGNGENRAPIPQSGYGDIPPTCADWWAGSNGLRARVASQLVVMHLGEENLPPAQAEAYLRAIQIVNYLNGADVDGWAGDNLPDDELQDIAIKLFLQNLPPIGVPANEAGPGLIARAASAVFDRTIFAGAGRVIDGAGQAGTGLFAAFTLPEYIAQQAELLVIRKVAPLLLGLILMVVIASAAIYFALSQYDLESGLKLFVFVASLAVIPVVWEVAKLIDSALYVSLVPDSNSWGVTGVVDRGVFDWTATIFYLIAPIVLIAVINLAGWRQIDALALSIGTSKAGQLGRDASQRAMP